MLEMLARKEKIRQEMEKERAEAEEVKNKMAEAEALKAQMAAEAAAAAAVAENEGNEEEVPEDDNLEPAVPEVVLYSLVDVKGTRGNLTARIKNIANDEITSVKVGDNLNGEVITSITSESVIVDRKGTEYVIKFPAN